MINFPTRSTDCDFHNPALVDLFISSNASVCFTLPFPSLGNSNHAVFLVSIDFPSNSKGNTPFHCIGYD